MTDKEKISFLLMELKRINDGIRNERKQVAMALGYSITSSYSCVDCGSFLQDMKCPICKIIKE